MKTDLTKLKTFKLKQYMWGWIEKYTVLKDLDKHLNLK